MAVTETVPAKAAERRTAPTRSFGPLLLRLHFYAGILVAPFLLVAATTGLLFTMAPTLDKIVYSAELTVDDPGTATLPLVQQIAAARAAHPDGDLTGVRVTEADRTTQVDFTSPELSAESELVHTVYVDPYTAEVTGQLTTWWTSTPLTTWLDQFHRDLHLGTTGELYSELAASWLWIIALGGVILWWRRTRSARRMLAPELKAKKGVRRTRSWHGALGVWLLLGLLIISATGLTWSGYAGANFGAALDAMDGNRPYVATEATASSGGHHGGPASGAGDPAAIDAVLTGARDAGLDGPVQISLPADAASTWTVTQNDNLWPVRLDSVALDSSGAIADRVDFADWPFLAKLTSWGVNAHMGLLFGVFNQLILAALAIGLITVIIWGYRMWWQRRPTRTDRRAPVGTPPARSAWQQLPTWGIVAGVPVVFGLAWALPLFGIPLVAFIVIDAIVGAVRGSTES
ncbi:putative iron-regulated membrane protein [Actinoplanes lutulentus]|uniref:Putative iron-regulated membrane protein n=1 Tax=Actinoplanes lutulentus TaxID=1287878 RepID=A0A327ZBL5_9ACTN|nr:PepSY domain-containing protein [Actinoplanes lutulentus]MBB2947859.1 putative iron-regulated membrane protein [Actinoplanes lutulentus]RAK29828.1 putative iron-regulated membrane protein [Actinoplanes lutulentus]